MLLQVREYWERMVYPEGMDQSITNHLRIDMIVDITTTGRKTGGPRRIEIWAHYVDGRVFITGSPGTRSWYANLVANPDFSFHLKDDYKADLLATARPILDTGRRRDTLSKLFEVSKFRQGQGMNVDEWVQNSPLVEVTLGSAGFS